MRELNATDRAWILEYRTSVEGHLAGPFSAARTTFPQADQVLDRFRAACEDVLERGWAGWPAVETSHNELCIALAILECPGYKVSSLQYEPLVPGCEQTIDFVAQGEDARRWIVDVKTIAPEHVDRWEQFERAKEEDWLTQGTDIVIFREWMGGEIWHSRIASRARMLEYTLEFESKLSTSYPDFDPSRTLLMLCGNGFHWHEDQLEDFVDFYINARHRFDDPLGAMETYHMERNGIVLPRRVKRFGYLERKSRAVVASRVTWHVRAPRFLSSMNADDAAV